MNRYSLDEEENRKFLCKEESLQIKDHPLKRKGGTTAARMISLHDVSFKPPENKAGELEEYFN